MARNDKRGLWLATLSVGLLIVVGALVAALVRGADDGPARTSEAPAGAALAEPEPLDRPSGGAAAPAAPARAATSRALGLAPAAPGPAPAAAPPAELPPPAPRAASPSGVAPAVVPRQILEEPDPQRRAQMLAKHRLTVARSRLAILRRRARMLAGTIESGHRAGAPRSGLERLERQLTAVQGHVSQADDEVRSATEAVAAAGTP